MAGRSRGGGAVWGLAPLPGGTPLADHRRSGENRGVEVRPLPLFARRSRATLANLKTFSLLGIDAVPVEVDVSPAGLPKTVLGGKRATGPVTPDGADESLGKELAPWSSERVVTTPFFPSGD